VESGFSEVRSELLWRFAVLLAPFAIPLAFEPVFVRLAVGHYSYEPFVENRTLRPNKTITFESGSKANGRNELTTAHIYNNDVGSREGARVKTSVGTFIDKC
jgi:hypothetical protein